MTGKTHMAISAATVAVVLSATGARASMGVPFLYMPTPVLGASQVDVYAIAGLLLLGVVAGLFPDLDAPDTELQHLPGRVADQLGWYITARIPGMLAIFAMFGMPRMRGHSRSSPLARLVRGSIRLAALPFTLLVGAFGAGLRASPLGTGHRGFTHTLWGTLVFTSLAASATLLITGSVSQALTVGAVWLLGYASHLAADACTPSGIPLLMPLKCLARASTTTTFPAFTAFHLLPKRMRVRTGTMADTLVLRWTAWTVCIVAVLSMFMA